MLILNKCHKLKNNYIIVMNTVLPPNSNNLQPNKKPEGYINQIVTSATDTIANVESQVIGAEAKVATTGAVAVAQAVDDTINTQGPKFMKALQSIINFFYKGKNIFKNAEANAEVDKLRIKQQSDAEQIEVLMKTGLTKDQAKEKYDKIEAKREKKEDTALRIEEAAAATAAAIKFAKASGGGRNMFSLHQIQKGGRQSAKRTKKSINEFLNTSVTSSQILNMIIKSDDHKRNTKVKRKINNGKYSRRVRAKKMH